MTKIPTISKKSSKRTKRDLTSEPVSWRSSLEWLIANFPRLSTKGPNWNRLSLFN
jgi:hypothetical protein